MKLELDTSRCPIVVPDTYGTGFCYQIADGMGKDFKQLMIDKAESYIADALAETIFADAKLTMGKFESPRFYNYETDKIYFTLEFDESKLHIISEVVRHTDFFEYSKKFDSCAGFISFYPVDKEKFYEALRNHDKRTDLAVAMYIMYQVEAEYDIDKYQNDYLDEVEDYASGNGYFEDEEAV